MDYKSVQPLAVNRSRRIDVSEGMTTGKAGKYIPLSVTPLLREDAVRRMDIAVAVQMKETVKPLMNAVRVRFDTVFVPFTAFERFDGMEDFNRAYTETPDGQGVVKPFVEPIPFASNDIYKSLGIHMPSGVSHNPVYIEAYNAIISDMYQSKSPNLASRTALDTTLATCFWHVNEFEHIKPDYDRSLIDGVVKVSSASPVAVKGLGTNNSYDFFAGTSDVHATGGDATFVNAQRVVEANYASGKGPLYIEEDPNNPGYPYIRVDFDDAAVHVSLTDIDMAKKAAGFDRLRTKYQGHNDDEIVELLMEGIRVPDALYKRPTYLASRTVQVDYNTIWATSGDALGQSATQGQARATMSVRVPSVNTGGVVMVLASVVPDQIFERCADPMLEVVNPRQFPRFEDDTLNPEPVEIVPNRYIDAAHTNPDAMFGYAPLNAKWNRKFKRLGGELYKPDPAQAFHESRAHLWTTEVVDPVLDADFYLADGVGAEPFADQLSDQFVFTVGHVAEIEGRTVFGPALLEVAAAE